MSQQVARENHPRKGCIYALHKTKSSNTVAYFDMNAENILWKRLSDDEPMNDIFAKEGATEPPKITELDLSTHFKCRSDDAFEKAMNLFIDVVKRKIL